MAKWFTTATTVSPIGTLWEVQSRVTCTTNGFSASVTELPEIPASCQLLAPGSSWRTSAFNDSPLDGTAQGYGEANPNIVPGTPEAFDNLKSGGEQGKETDQEKEEEAM